MDNSVIHFAVAAGILLAAASAQAEVSQREQQKAAQRAYQESAKSYDEAAKGFEKLKKRAEFWRDTAKDVMKEAEKELIKRGK